MADPSEPDGLMPERSPVVTFLSLLATFAGGIGSGWLLRSKIAPESTWAVFVCVFPFPASLFFGYTFWSTRIVVTAVGRGLVPAGFSLVRRLFRRGARSETPLLSAAQQEALRRSALRSTRAFVQVSIVFALLAAAGSLLITTPWSRAAVALVLLGAIVAYGFVLTRAAGAGFLPPPE